MLLSDSFLLCAKKRVSAGHRLTEGDLRRCVSDLYFALFHAICETLAGMIQGDERLPISKEAWLRLYRLPDHAAVAKACDDGRIVELSQPVQQFASQFKAMKVLREDADYDASKPFEISEVRKIVQLVETVLANFKSADLQQRLKFAVLVSIKRR